jgi:hypothetical protein
MWYWIFHSFTAAVCQAVLVIVAPFHPLAPLAFESMNAAIELFEKADGDRARSAAARVKALAEKASFQMEAYNNASSATPEDQEAASPANEVSSTSQSPRDIARVQFPESNLRGSPEDLLGASTKLIRKQPEPAHSPSSLTPFPVLPYHNTADMDLSTAMLLLPEEQLQAAWSISTGHTEPHGFPHSWGEFNMVFDASFETPGIDPGGNLNIDGFDLSSFIHSGADAWLLDPAMELGTDILR